MCDPLTIAGIALSAGSMVANTIAQNNVRKAREDTMAAERIRQSALDQEAQALNTTSQDRYQGFEGQQQDKASQLGDYFANERVAQAADNAAATDAMVVPQTGSNVVLREEQKQRDAARNYTDNQGKALGNLRAFGDLVGSIGRSQAQDASQIGQIGGFKRGSSSIVPLELEQANKAGDGLKMFGDILGLGGSLALNKGLGGSPTGGSDPWAGLRGVGSTAPSSGGGILRLFR